MLECAVVEALLVCVPGRPREQKLLLAEKASKRGRVQKHWQLVVQWLTCPAVPTEMMAEDVQLLSRVAVGVVVLDLFQHRFPWSFGASTTPVSTRRVYELMRQEALMRRAQEELLLVEDERVRAIKVLSTRLTLLWAHIARVHAQLVAAKADVVGWEAELSVASSERALEVHLFLGKSSQCTRDAVGELHVLEGGSCLGMLQILHQEFLLMADASFIPAQPWQAMETQEADVDQ